jgi:hypothetical protein
MTKTKKNPSAVAKRDAARSWKSNKPNQQTSTKPGSAAAAANKTSVLYQSLFSLPSSSSSSSRPSILLVGEGDFTFAASLHATFDQSTSSTSAAFHPTSYDKDKGSVIVKYPKTAPLAIERLQESGVKVSFGVDATNLNSTLSKANKSSSPITYDRIIWMFPHSGEQRVHINRTLLYNFFGSLKDSALLTPQRGIVYVTLTDGRPYSDWRLVESAEEQGFSKVSERKTSGLGAGGGGKNEVVFKHVTTLGGKAYDGAHGTMETRGELGAVVHGFTLKAKVEVKVIEEKAKVEVADKYGVCLGSDDDEEEELEVTATLPPTTTEVVKKKKNNNKNKRKKGRKLESGSNGDVIK